MNSVCIGRREEGKSTLALFLAHTTHTAVVVFDPRGIFAGHIVRSKEELEDALKDGLYEDGLPLVYRFDSTDPEEAFTEMSAALFPPHFTRGGFCLIVDEAGMLQGQNTMHPELRRAISQHPTKGPMRIHIIQTTHRLQELHGKVKTCLDNLYVFCTKNARDHVALVEFTDEPELVEVVKELPKHHLVHYKFARQDPGEPQYEIWDDPTDWYISLASPKVNHDDQLTIEDVEHRDELWRKEHPGIEENY
jgi:hypothetical protein